MDILKHQFPIKSLIFLKSNCHAKMAPDTGRSRRQARLTETAQEVGECSSLANRKDGIAEDGEIGLDPKTGTVGGGHETLDPLRRAGRNVERAVAVEVGRRKAELL